jgi:hypothetical protein
MADPLADIYAKFGWAQRHDRRWHALFGRWLDRKPYGVRGQPEVATGTFVIRAVERYEPPVVLPLLYADLVHNLRAVLDHIVCQLVILNGGSCDKDTSFPVVMKDKDWKSVVGNQLKGFPKEWRGIVKSFQPFHYGTRNNEHPLRVLHRIDIDSKHERLVPLVLMDFEIDPTFKLNRNAREGDAIVPWYATPGTELNKGIDLARYSCVSQNDDLRIVEMTSVKGLRASFGPGSSAAMEFTSSTFPNLVVFVGSVIQALAPAFE